MGRNNYLMLYREFSKILALFGGQLRVHIGGSLMLHTGAFLDKKSIVCTSNFSLFN